MALLAEAGADRDSDLVAAALSLMKIVNEIGTNADKYTVDARGAQGIQIGDRNQQDNVFNGRPMGGRLSDWRQPWPADR